MQIMKNHQARQPFFFSITFQITICDSQPSVQHLAPCTYTLINLVINLLLNLSSTSLPPSPNTARRVLRRQLKLERETRALGSALELVILY